MNESIITTLHFHKLGNGPIILLAFHGIGQDGISCFKPFSENLGNYYTVYAFDLYFHGKSIESSEVNFFSNQVITKKIWAKTIQEFLHKEKISRFDVAGFSMGGRFALATLEAFSNQIDKAFLIAPDGISEHPLYTLASGFKPTRKLFGWLMQNPNSFFKAANIFQKAGFVHSSLYRFTQHVLNTSEKRQSVYNSWVGFRKLHFEIPELYQKIKVNDIDLYLFIGKYDKLLKEKGVIRLANLLPADRYIILQNGHSQLVEKVAFYLKNILKN
ncbi:alpha/beta hydrolase [Dyadobacter sp. NIV53]|uniref:alpha/beta hydrolase n=1 Tax=Dyadobacter sp. NIV53 TaxID=2861765 RepID=UPI001E496A34|nr:alpha/beta hydrolase [Dyadobacter sp. NIV53]